MPGRLTQCSYRLGRSGASCDRRFERRPYRPWLDVEPGRTRGPLQFTPTRNPSRSSSGSDFSKNASSGISTGSKPW
jgi:hypothetical protein